MKITAGNQLGYVLFNLETQQRVQSLLPDEKFIPASTSKILSSFFALEVLGANHRFKTSLIAKGPIHNGTLKGDLFLRGGGDPALTASHLMGLVEALAARGVKRVAGDFFYDESALISSQAIQPLREPWAPYNCGLSALSLEFNQYRMKWKGKNSYFVPELGDSQMKRLRRKLPAETGVLYEGSEKSALWSLAQNESKEGEKRLPLKNPALHVAQLFYKFCRMYKIELSEPRPGVAPSNGATIVQHDSPPLLELLDRALEFSNNFISELTHMMAASHLSQKPVGIREAAEISEKWFVKTIGHPNSKGFHLENGSGLNSNNRISPTFLVEVLKHANSKFFEGKTFQSLLPVSGWKGSLSNRWTEPELAFHIWAKPGAMNFVYALAGYLFNAKGERLIFSIMLQNLKLRAEVDTYTDPLPDNITKKAQHWTLNALSQIDTLLKCWVNS